MSYVYSLVLRAYTIMRLIQYDVQFMHFGASCLIVLQTPVYGINQLWTAHPLGDSHVQAAAWQPLGSSESALGPCRSDGYHTDGGARTRICGPLQGMAPAWKLRPACAYVAEKKERGGC
jgi:hypothetical protein